MWIPGEKSYVIRTYEDDVNKLMLMSYSSLCNLAISSHLFLVERGRWGRNRIEYKDILCTMCNTIEDEFHCLIECPNYIKERKGCLPEILIRRPSMFEFIKYLRCDNKNELSKLGLLCFKIMKKHRDTHILMDI